jgi:hypothetical protein
VVADLVGAVLAPEETDDGAFGKVALALGRAERRLSAHDEEPLLVRVVGVVGAEPVARVELVQGPAEKLGPDVLAHPGVLAAPALAVLRAIPLVSVQVEDLYV